MKRLYYLITSLIYPAKCMLCGDILQAQETDLCTKCRKETENYPYGALNPAPKGKNPAQFLDSFTAIWYYENDVRKSIHRFKFRRGVHLAPKYGRLLAMKLLQLGPESFDILTWVPVSTLRRATRGYDQGRLLAKYVGQELEIRPYRLLRKVRNNPPQSGIADASKRKANVLGAYRMAKGADVRGKRILILDDVFTTGATVEECARVLLSAGAKEVHCAAVAAVHHRKK